MKLFDNDFWEEIIQTITQQKSRSIMTAFGVFWGIFMLVLLVGVGIGVDNGIVASYTCVPQNSIYAVSRPTTKPYHGLEQGRDWHMKNSDLDVIHETFDAALEHVVGITYAPQKSVPITYGARSSHYELCGTTPEMIDALPHKVLEGRYINKIDLDEKRNVCVIGENVSKLLFGDSSPLGKHVTINNQAFTVVGVTARTNNRIKIGPDIPNAVLMPLTVMQQTFNLQETIHVSIFVLKEDADVDAYQQKIISMMKERNDINPEDTEAVYNFNLKSYTTKYLSLQTGINLLIWIVGLGTLLAGLIGISNIMIITITERTKEIGVRRALGAMPETIITQILCESLVLTFTAGFAGLAAGVYILAVVSNVLPPASQGGVIAEPYVPVLPAIAAFIIIIIGGLLAGWLPARRALAIKPIEALREE